MILHFLYDQNFEKLEGIEDKTLLGKPIQLQGNSLTGENLKQGREGLDLQKIPQSQEEIKDVSNELNLSEIPQTVDEVEKAIKKCEGQLDLTKIPQTLDEVERAISKEQLDLTKVPQTLDEVERAISKEQLDLSEIPQSMDELNALRDFQNKNIVKNSIHKLMRMSPEKRESLRLPRDYTNHELDIFFSQINPPSTLDRNKANPSKVSNTEGSKSISRNDREKDNKKVKEVQEQQEVKENKDRENEKIKEKKSKDTNTEKKQQRLIEKYKVSESKKEMEREIETKKAMEEELEKHKEIIDITNDIDDLEQLHGKKCDLIDFCKNKLREGNFNGIITHEGYEKKLKELIRENEQIEKQLRKFSDNTAHLKKLDYKNLKGRKEEVSEKKNNMLKQKQENVKLKKESQKFKEMVKEFRRNLPNREKQKQEKQELNESEEISNKENSDFKNINEDIINEREMTSKSDIEQNQVFKFTNLMDKEVQTIFKDYAKIFKKNANYGLRLTKKFLKWVNHKENVKVDLIKKFNNINTNKEIEKFVAYKLEYCYLDINEIQEITNNIGLKIDWRKINYIFEQYNLNSIKSEKKNMR